MGDVNKNAENPIFGDSEFPYFIIIAVICLHVTVMVIIIYYSCCRNRKCCECIVNIQNNTIHQHGQREALGGSTDSESLVQGPTGNSQGTRRQDSFLDRLRTRLHSDRVDNIAPASTVAGQPPPYEESAEGFGTNAGANFSDTDLQLPSYDAIVRPLPQWNEEKGCFEEEMPPTYEEAIKAKTSRR